MVFFLMLPLWFLRVVAGIVFGGLIGGMAGLIGARRVNRLLRWN
jgi:hypothetical protein